MGSPINPPFIIYALPRSRTFWLSKFLTCSKWVCGHDELRYARGFDDVHSWFAQPYIGTVETMAAPFWRLVHHYQPNIRTAVVHRPVDEVVDSLLRLGLGPAEQLRRRMVYLEHKLEQIERRVQDVLSLEYGELDTPEGCAKLYEHCTGETMAQEWWAGLASLNLQINMPALVRYVAAYRPQLEKLAAMAKQQTIAHVLLPAATSEIEGVTFQQEPFDDRAIADAEQLAREHCVQVGELPD
ncbi:MAG TPA: hypothetical protein VHA37_10240, partial [Candidatus Saccharimonadales bacterium]|nr:hypothetical protein [Candidatus Saccharimonadales bacterium]